MNSRKNLQAKRAKNLWLQAGSVALLLSGAGCASIFSRSNQTEEKQPGKQGENSYSATEESAGNDSANPEIAHAKDQKIQSLESTVATLNTKIQSLEGKLQAVENPPKFSESALRQNSDAKSRPGSTLYASVASSDPESGYANDANTRAFQQGKILFDQEKYPEAILALSAFLERVPGHALASSVQYYIAESYFQQSDFAVADQEFQKLLLKYPHSPRSSYALVRLAQATAKLGKNEESRRYRLQAEGLYAKSPALKTLNDTPATAGIRMQNSNQSSLVIPPTAPEVDSPRVESPIVDSPRVESPRVDTPMVEAPKAPRVDLRNNNSGDLDSPPGMGGGG